MKQLNASHIMILILIGLITTLYYGGKDYIKGDQQGEAYKVVVEKILDSEALELIDITMSSEDVIFATTNSDQINLYYENYVYREEDIEKMKNSLHIKQDDDSLTIYKDHFDKNGISGIDSFFYFISSGFKINGISPKLRIDLPEDYDQHLTIKTSSGDISVNHPKLEKGNFISSSGDQKITVKEINSTKNTASSGEVTLNNIKADSVTVTTSSGEVNYSGTAKNFIGNASSGDYNLIINDDEGKYIISTSSGEIDIDLAKNRPYTFESSTSSGDFSSNNSLHFSQNKEHSKKGYYLNDDDQLEFKLSSSSGDHSIN